MVLNPQKSAQSKGGTAQVGRHLAPPVRSAAPAVAPRAALSHFSGCQLSIYLNASYCTLSVFSSRKFLGLATVAFYFYLVISVQS